MPLTIRADVKGLKPTLANLEGLKKALRNKILRKAVSAAAKPILDTAKAVVTASRGTGLLRRSLGRRVKVAKGKVLKGQVIGIIGPRKGFEQEVPARSGGTKKADPRRYAHLVEFGHALVRGGKHGKGGRVIGRVPPYPFLGPALQSNSTQCLSIIATEVAKGLAQEVGKT